MAFLETSDVELDIAEQQQHLFELFGHPSSIIYDCYTTKESLALKINLILPQMNEAERNDLITTIWNQNEFNGKNCLFMSPIYITLILDNQPSTQSESKIISKNFQVHPVFRIRKCITESPDAGSSNCCAIFIDEFGRVYMNWAKFREDNAYDDGLVVAPFNGIYNGSENGNVKLELFERQAGITKTLDRSSMVVGLASASIAVVTFIPALTIAPMVVAGAAAAGLSCAVYTGVRGIYTLYDRKKHQQTINFTNREARSSWINVAAGAFSASAVSATQILAKTAHNSNGITHIIRSTAHALHAGAFGLHTTSCLDDIYILFRNIHEFENISMSEISHLSTLLFLLTHSIKNHQIAEKMLALSRRSEVSDLKKILRESQKLAISALVHETMKIQSNQTNKTDHVVVRSLKNWIDPQPILMELDDEDQEGAEKPNTRKELAKREYVEIFDSRVASIVRHVLAKFKSRGENELKLFMINVMKEVSLHLFDDFIDLVESTIEKYGTMIESRSQNVVTFEHIAIMILKQLNVISKDSNVTDLKKYLLGLTETERSKIDDLIRNYFEHMKEEHVQHAEELLASHMDISDDEKVNLVIDGEVDNVIRNFKTAHIVDKIDDLRETVKDVFLNLKLKASHKFFGIVTNFMLTSSSHVQSRLGRFISVDIFMTDIYTVLRKVSVNCGQELEHYLLGYYEDEFHEIEKYIHHFYDNQNMIGNSNKCNDCGGFYFN